MGPGPGWYDHRDTKMKVAYSMGAKADARKSSDLLNKSLPGPGQYTPRDAFYRTAGGRIGTERRVGPISKANYLGGLLKVMELFLSINYFRFSVHHPI